MTVSERFARVLFAAITIVCLVFLLTPLVITIAVSFGSSSVFTLPPPDWSFAWYERMSSRPGLLRSVLLSVEIALISTAAALVLGTLCAIALARGRFPGKAAIATFLVSPLMLPGLVLGIAMLQAFRMAGLRDVVPSLLIAHVVITLPYVTRTVFASLSLFDFTLIDAARTLGCTPAAAVRKVMIPALAPAFLASGLFGFLASLDNYPISIFFTDPRTKTLPIQMLQFLEEQPDPTIAAMSACLIALAAAVLALGDRLVGIRKLADL